MPKQGTGKQAEEGDKNNFTKLWLVWLSLGWQTIYIYSPSSPDSELYQPRLTMDLGGEWASGHGSVLGQRPARVLAVRGEETEAPTGSEPCPRQRWGLEEPAIQGFTAEGARHITRPSPGPGHQLTSALDTAPAPGWAAFGQGTSELRLWGLCPKLWQLQGQTRIWKRFLPSDLSSISQSLWFF